MSDEWVPVWAGLALGAVAALIVVVLAFVIAAGFGA